MTKVLICVKRYLNEISCGRRHLYQNTGLFSVVGSMSWC